MTIKFTNNATTTLASGINSSATSLTVATGTGALFPSLSGSDVFYVTLANLTGTVEIVKVTARSSDTFTIVRAQDNTTATSWTTGDKVELRPTAVALTAMAQTANNLSDVANPTTAANNLGLNPVGNGFKNRVINGAMMIDQRNAGASFTPTNNNYTVDRYKYFSSQASKFTAQQTPSATETGYATRVGAGFTNYLAFTSSSAYSVGASDYFSFGQLIEGYNVADLAYGTANAKTVTISFWAYSSLTGTFNVMVSDGSFTYGYGATYSIPVANTWTYITIAVPGATTGTWNKTTSAGLALYFNLGSGSSASTSAGSWGAWVGMGVTGATSVVGTSGATFYITGVQLEKGSTATSFDYRPYGTELALCQRYYYKTKPPSANTPFGNGYSTSSTAFNCLINFPVSMRTNPTSLEQTGTAGDYAQESPTGATLLTGVPTFARASTILATITATTTGLTTGQGVITRCDNTNAYLAWSAEL